MGAGVARRLVEADAGDEAGDVGLELDADRHGVGVAVGGEVGLSASPKIEQGHDTVTPTGVGVVWMLPLSSVARAFTEPAPVPGNEPV